MWAASRLQRDKVLRKGRNTKRFEIGAYMINGCLTADVKSDKLPCGVLEQPTTAAIATGGGQSGSGSKHIRLWDCIANWERLRTELVKYPDEFVVHLYLSYRFRDHCAIFSTIYSQVWGCDWPPSFTDNDTNVWLSFLPVIPIFDLNYLNSYPMFPFDLQILILWMAPNDLRRVFQIQI